MDCQVKISDFILQVKYFLCLFKDKFLTHRELSLELDNFLFQIPDSLLQNISLVSAHTRTHAVT